MDTIVLKPWQKTTLEKFLKEKKVFLEWDVGTGKTFFMAYCIALFSKQYPAFKAIFISPPKSFPSIKTALKNHGLTEVDLLDTTQKKKEWLFNPKTRKNICVLSSFAVKDDNFLQVIGRNRAVGKLIDFNPHFILLDESHVIKSERSQVSKSIKAFFETVNPEYRMLGSGTPVGNNELDFFNQAFCLDKTILGPSFYAFRNKYFYNTTQKQTFSIFKMVASLKPDFIKKISTLKTVAKIEDTGEKLAKRMYHKCEFDMYKEQKEVYLSLKNDLAAEFIDGEKQRDELITKNPALKSKIDFQWYQHVLQQMSALRQVCNGFLYERMPENLFLEDQKEFIKKRKCMTFATPKLDALRNGVTKLDGKILIWSVYLETFKHIEAVLSDCNIQYVTITGKTPMHKRSDLIDEFKTNPDCKVFLSNPKSGGTGLNLPEAKYSLWYSQDFSFIDKVQSAGRNFRINTFDHNPSIFYYEFLIKNSIETKIQTKIESKRRIAEDFKNFLLN